MAFEGITAGVAQKRADTYLLHIVYLRSPDLILCMHSLCSYDVIPTGIRATLLPISEIDLRPLLFAFNPRLYFLASNSSAF